MVLTGHTLQQSRRMKRPFQFSDPRVIACFTGALAWVLCVLDWMAWKKLSGDYEIVRGSVFLVAAIIAVMAIVLANRSRTNRPVLFSVVASLAFIPIWTLSVYGLGEHGLDWSESRAWVARFGTGSAYIIGLMWVVWGIEKTSRYYDQQRRLRVQATDEIPVPTAVLHETAAIDELEDENHPESRTSNPLDAEAWFYGKKSKRLNQSVTAFLGYTFGFFFAFIVMTNLGGCSELYEMPQGGGEQAQIAQVVKVQKVIRKKFVVNPFSAISFKVPPIDEIKLQLTEITKHAYTVGYGAGKGAGFAGGTKLGKVRFIRLEYSGGDWDEGYGIGSDVNMLIEYGVRTQQKVANRTESRTVSALKNFPVGKSPPMVYITGNKGSIRLTKSEIKTLHEYLMEKHGMLFADAGSRGWHNQCMAMMRQVLPEIRPTPVPLDDVIHRIPYQIPFLPYVAPHGGKEALAWRIDGRIVAYYHPGDIGDAWTDDHSGVSPVIYEACYQLGTNIIFYAHSEYAKWLESQNQNP